MTGLRRVEIAIENGQVTGAQMTDANGTRGVNTGNYPEYADTLETVLGEALTVALTTIDTQAARISDLEGQLAAGSAPQPQGPE